MSKLQLVNNETASLGNETQNLEPSSFHFEKRDEDVIEEMVLRYKHNCQDIKDLVSQLEALLNRFPQ